MIDSSIRLSLTHNMLGQLFSLKRKIGQKVRSASRRMWVALEINGTKKRLPSVGSRRILVKNGSKNGFYWQNEGTKNVNRCVSSTSPFLVIYYNSV